MLHPQGVLNAISVLVFETAELRRERDNGFHHIHEDPCSVAEHSHRGSVLGFLLASYAKQNEPGFENVDPCYVSSLISFHDLHEARTGDDDLVQKRYCKIDGEAAIKDQTQGLGMLSATIHMMWKEVDTGSTPSGKLAKDCEILERAFTAREIVFFKGNIEAQAWIDAIAARLKTQSAKDLLEILNGSDPNEWWKQLLGYPIRKSLGEEADGQR